MAKLSLRLLLTGCFLWGSLVQGDDADVVRTTLKEFEQVRSTLKEALGNSDQCNLFADQSGKVQLICNYKDYCESLRKQPLSAASYQSNRKGDSGGRIANAYLASLESKIASCFFSRTMENHTKKMIDKIKSMGKPISEISDFDDALEHEKQKLTEEAKLSNRFFALLNASPEDQKTWLLYQTENAKIIQEIARNSEKIEDRYFAQTASTKKTIPWAKKGAESNLALLEKRTGRKFKDRVRRLYLDLQVLPYKKYNDTSISLPFWDPISDSVTQNPALGFDLKTAGSKKRLKDYQTKYQRLTDRVFQTFEKTQGQMIKFLETRANSGNQEKVKALIQRLQTIQFKVPPLSSDASLGSLLGQNPCVSPNAFYDPTTHSFTICNQLLDMPEETLAMVIGHELGHSIDPCLATFDLLKFTGSETGNAARLKKKKDEIERKVRATEKDEYPYEPKIKKVGFIASIDLNTFQSAERAKSPLEDEFKALFKSEKIASGVSLDSHPLRGVVECLGSPESIGSKIPKESEILKHFDERIEVLKRTGMTPETSSEYAELLRKRANSAVLAREKAGCAFVNAGEKSEIQESFADWIAANAVIGPNLKAAPENDRKNMAADALAFFPTLHCAPEVPKLTEKVTEELKKIGCIKDGVDISSSLGDLYQLKNRSTDPHPEGIDRINKILWANPEVRKAFGCGPKPEPKECG